MSSLLPVLVLTALAVTQSVVAAQLCEIGVPSCCDREKECDDGDACNGTESCDRDTGTCGAGSPVVCESPGDCLVAVCEPVSGSCVPTPAPLGTPCEDGNACTTDDTCIAGVCVGGPAPECADTNPCTDDTCAPATGCVHPDNTDPCDDLNACTTADTCTGGTCVGGPETDCADRNSCTDDVCVPAIGCVYTNNTSSCDDGNACTTADTCAGGSCLGGPAPDCSDPNPCTDDTCAPATGCVHTNNEAACHDGSACTTGDMCDDGRCVSGPAPDCNDGNPCTTDSCSPGTGCVHTPNTASCDDGNACTTNDTCAAGVCVGGPARDCSDPNPCTDDACVPTTGCVHTNNADACDDGNACTTADTCAGGSCVGGNGPDCNDGNPCTDDACTPGSGCVHTDNRAACEDGNACTAGDRCSGGACVGGAAPDCSDQNPCTDDSCAPSIGCVHDNNTASCTDQNACTTADHCVGGACVGGAAPDCNDGNPCTDDTCSATNGCVHTNNAATCNDSNPCTTPDTCSNGACTGGPPPTCDDGDPCTKDSCMAATGCQHVTVSGCHACNIPADCNDGSPCTTEQCVGRVCQYVNNTAACDDGNGCTRTDRCQAGTCVGTDPIVCPEPDQCHAPGTCNPANGICSNPALPNGTSCNDGTACTRTDRCQAGLCIGVDPVLCPTPDQCHHLGRCDAATGVCSRPNRPDGTVCNDGTACTRQDTCQTGVCAGTNPVICPVPDQCHAFGTCDPGTGVCSNPALPDGSACFDGTACTRIDRCAGGLCAGTDPVICPAPDACHFPGSCDPGTGICSNPSQPNATPCNDRDACTVGDRCVVGTCSGVLRSCDDGASCSDDACVDGECQHQPVDARCETGECALNRCQPGARGADPSGCAGEPVSEGEVCTDDGFACTTDVCTAGACRHTAAHERCATGEVCGPTVCDPVHTQADAAGCVALFDQVSGKECAEDGDPCTHDSCAAGACAHAQVPNKSTCDPVRPAFERAQALAAAAQGLSALVSAVLSPAAEAESRQALMGGATEVASSLERVTRILAGKTADTQIAPRATRGTPAEGDTVAMARARIAFVEMQHTPRAVQAFLQDLAVARERALVARSSATDLRKRGRELRRGTRVLKRDLKRLQRVPRSFTR